MAYTLSWTQKKLGVEALQTYATLLTRVIDLSRVTLRLAIGMVTLQSAENLGDTFVVRPGVAHSASCTTNGAPYTADMMAACVLGYEMGIISDYTAEDMSGFQEALDLVDAKVGPLKTFAEQEARITRMKREADAAAVTSA